MVLAIHNDMNSYSKRWVEYCVEKDIDYKLVDCYSTAVVAQVKGCDALFWHHNHADYKDVIFAKQLLFSLQQCGVKTFPDFNTGWHFDDKLGQKYLFESCEVNAAKSYVFYTRGAAKKWVRETTFPKVFKLRGGASASNVKLVKTSSDAKRLIKKAFNAGFPLVDTLGLFKDTYRLYKQGKSSKDEVKFFLNAYFFPKKYKYHLLPRQKGYVYFQEFIPNDGFDYRVQITGKYAICMVRYARKDDFRASGGHHNKFDKSLIPLDVIKFAFQVYKKLKLQSCALDIVRHNGTNELFLIETSYCYGIDKDEFDHGYWDEEGNWYNKPFDSRDWMVDLILNG